MIAESARKRTPLAAAAALGISTLFAGAAVGAASGAVPARTPFGSDIRSVSFADTGPPGYRRPGDTACFRYYKGARCLETKGQKFNDDLAAALPRIKAAGFNTVRLNTAWIDFDPTPLAGTRTGCGTKRRFNDGAFATLRRTLALLRENHMRVLLSLPMLGFSDQKYPLCVDFSTWVTDPQQFDAYRVMAKVFLTRIQDYSDIAYPWVKTEMTARNAPTLVPRTKVTPANAIAHAALLRSTLGALPDWIASQDPALRAKFRFVYHDGWWLLANLIVTNQVARVDLPQFLHEITPVASPDTYDLYSITSYQSTELTQQDWPAIQRTLAQQIANVRTALPGIRFIYSEFGATMCHRIAGKATGGSEATQALIDKSFVQYMITRGIGFNLWVWGSRNTPCQGVDKGYPLTGPDGSPRQALAAVQSVLTRPPSR